MELKKIFNIIDKDESKLSKLFATEDKDLNFVTDMVLKAFSMQIKKSLEEADKNEH